MMSPATLLSIVLGVLTLYVTKALWTRKKSSKSLPPGPPGMPILGNIADLPPVGVQDWMHWIKHNDLYGMCASSSTLLYPCYSASGS